MTSGIREQSVPEWLQQFTDRLTEKAVDSSSSAQGEKVPEAPPSRVPAKIQINKFGAKYYVFTHFPTDPNCQVCKRTKAKELLAVFFRKAEEIEYVV